MPRPKSKLPRRPVKGTWESFAKANGLNQRESSVELRLTLTINNNDNDNEPAKRRFKRL